MRRTINQKYVLNFLIFTCACFTSSMSVGEIIDSPSSIWSIEVDTDSGGLTSWEDQDQAYLFQHSFWYRINPVDGFETPVDSASFTLTSMQTNVNSISMVLENTDLSVDISYEVRDGFADLDLGDTVILPTTSEISQSVAITNRTANSLDVTWFEYTDLDIGLADQGSGDQLFIQQKPDLSAFEEGRIGVYEHFSGTAPQLFELAIVGDADDIEDRLNDGDITDLLFNSPNNDFLGTFDDLAFAKQWDAILAPNGTAGDTLSYQNTLGTTNTLVPEPSTYALFLGVVAAAAVMQRSRKNTERRSES